MKWDYIIVGAGSTGCALASRLSEDPNAKVLLTEAGGSDRSPIILAPAATDLYAIGRPAWDWCFKAEPDPTRHGRSDFWPRGKVLGGSSSINGTIYVRGQAEDYDAWAKEGADGWSYQDVLPYFKRSERNDLGASEYHGDHGPLSVQQLRTVHPLTKLFIDAGVQNGLPLNTDVNGASQYGIGLNQATQKRGWRHNAARAYLTSARNRPNLKILTRAQVIRVLFSGIRAVGIEYSRGGKLHQAMADREVTLAAGAIGSPHLLMLSGVGDGLKLRSLGIPVIAERPQVGANLQEHPVVWLTYRMRVATLNNEKSLVKQAVHGLNWFFFGKGPATTAASQAVAFFSTQNKPRADIQLHFTPVGYEFTPTEVKLHDESTVSVAVNVCRPLSRGQISLRSPDPAVPPRIEMPLLGSQEDLTLLSAGCRRARQIMNEPAMASLVLDERSPGRHVATDEAWESYLRDAVAPAYHPVGTCRMGSDPGSVVDSVLCVRGVAGLRVADASIMPRIVSGNTNAAAIMIGEKAADLIRGTRR